jgi:sensor histidine kinase YesM
VDKACSYYTQELGQTLEKAADTLEELAISNINVQMVKYAQDKLTLIQNAQIVNRNLNFYQESLGYEFHFFVYYDAENYFNSSDLGSLIQPDRDKWNKQVYEYVQKDYENRGANNPTNWEVGKIDGEFVVYHYVTYQGVFSCCYIFLSDIQKDEDFLGMGTNSHMTLLSPDNTVYGSHDKLKTIGIYNNETGKVNIKKWRILDGEIINDKAVPHCNFRILAVIINSPVMAQSIWIMIILSILLVLAFGFALGMLYLIRIRMFKPIQYFADTLEQITLNQEEVFFEDNSIHELAKANELFRQIIGQMKELKIEMYEQELKSKELDIEKQQLTIDYMQLQIQPHFYINSLTMIYNLANIGDYETIEQLAVNISNYFRYIFKKHSEYAELSEELNHINNYLEIYKINKPSQVSYEVKKSNGLSDVVIPILLLHTFVENALKYGINNEGKIHVTVKAEYISIQETEFVSLSVEDRGKGFPENILEKLYAREEIVTDKGSRIGIRNCLIRMNLMYHGKEKVSFFNLDSGGACVKICIPIVRREKENEYTTD